MTIELLLVILLIAGAAVLAGLGVLLLAAFGPAGWIVVLALLAAAAVVWRIAAAPADWQGEDLRDDWRAG
jgi:hypothetical protein